MQIVHWKLGNELRNRVLKSELKSTVMDNEYSVLVVKP
jgi:hypothetical protein